MLFSNNSFLVPGAVFHYDPEEGRTTKTALASNPPVDLAAMGVTVKREFATSKDGTRIPVNILLPLNARLAGSAAPAGLVTGYGGYNISLAPRFNALNAVLLEQGVVIAVANLRGGGEYGEEWHKQGNLTNKQNVFDDFAAVLEHLVKRGFIDGSRLAPLQIQPVQLRMVFKDDFTLAIGPRAVGRPLDVVVLEVSNLGPILRIQIVGPDIQSMIRAGIGQIVNLVTVPHRDRVRAFPVGDSFRRVIG